MTERRVYFLQNGPHIKIGHSKNVARRVGNLATATAGECTLIGAALGDRKVERALHRHLSAHNVKGEWFNDCPEVRAAMIQLQAEGDAFLFPQADPVKEPEPEPEPVPDLEPEPWMSNIACVEEMQRSLDNIHAMLTRRAIYERGYC